MFPTPSVADSGAQVNMDLNQELDDRIIQQAIALLEQRVFNAGPTLNGPKAVRDYLRLKLMAEPNEVFVVVFLDSQHQVLACEPLFKGSIREAPVYPRVVVQRALELNASALILSHQHPSGIAEPSMQDRAITNQLQHILRMVDIQIVDHFIIGKGEPYSFAESGLL